MKCGSKHQQHQSNLEYGSAEDFFKKTVITPMSYHLHGHSKQVAAHQEILPLNH